MKRDHWKITLTVTFWRLLKFLKLKENSTAALRLLKLLIQKKGLHCSLTTLKVFNPEKRHHHCLKVFNTKKGLHHFLRTLKVSNIEKGLHHFLETLKGFNFEKWLRHVLITRKVYQNSCSVECWWTAASEGRLSYHLMISKLHLLWVPNFIAIEIYFLSGTKFSWNEETDTCFNVECMLLGRNYDFLGGYLVATARYVSVTTG